MDALVIEATSNTPRVEFNPAGGTFELSGVSIPEDTVAFYTPVLGWLEQYIALPDVSLTEFRLRINYFNTSSSKVLLDMLYMLVQLEQKPSICWHCKAYDLDMEETVKDFESVLGHDICLVKETEE